MESALETFRAQREAADQVHARVTEVAQLLEQLTRQVDAVAGNADLERPFDHDFFRAFRARTGRVFARRRKGDQTSRDLAHVRLRNAPSLRLTSVRG